MKSNGIGTYVWVGLIIASLVLVSLNFGVFSTIQNRISGFDVATTVFVFGEPEPPMLTAWLQNFGNYAYNNGSHNGTVFLNWTQSPSPYIANYLLYETTNYTAGFIFSQPSRTFPNDMTNASDPDASNYREIYYILRSNTTYNLQDQNTLAWGKFTRTLYATPKNGNMNLVSTGPMSINKTFDEMFIQNITNYTVIQVYKRNSTTGKYSLADYYGGDGIDAWWSPDSKFKIIAPNEAYWVKVTQNTSWPVVGNITKVNQTVQLYAIPQTGRMNLFGWASVTHGNFADVIKQDLTNYSVIQVYRRNDVTGKYSLADYYGGDGIDAWWSPDPTFTGFDPGYGYWIKTIDNFTLVYEPNKV